MPDTKHPLHPATILGLQRTRELYAPPCNPAKREYTYVDPVYLCPICGDDHDNEQSALDCCQTDAPALDKIATTCPICQAEHTDSNSAAHCCLWKDTTWLQRFLIGNAVEAGSTWHEAVERFTNIDPLATR